MPRRVLDRIREKIRQRQYDLTRHANDEAAEDLLSIADVEGSILNGRIIKIERHDPRGTKSIIHAWKGGGSRGIGGNGWTFYGDREVSHHHRSSWALARGSLGDVSPEEETLFPGVSRLVERRPS